MKNFVIASLFACFVGSFNLSISAETTGWSWAGFSSKKTTSEIGVQTPTSKSWIPEIKMPDVAGSMKKAGKSVTTTTNNAWKATTRTTKQAWNKTTEFLDRFPTINRSRRPHPSHRPAAAFPDGLAARSRLTTGLRPSMIS